MSVEELGEKLAQNRKDEMNLLKEIITTQAKIIDELHNHEQRISLMEKAIRKMLEGD